MAVDPNIKVLDLHLAVADPRSEVVDLKQEVPERRSGGIRPNLTPGLTSHQLVSKINPEGSALRVILPLPMEHCSSQAYNN